MRGVGNVRKCTECLTIKGVLLRSEAEPATTPLVEHCPAAMSGIPSAKPLRRACARQQDHPDVSRVG